MHAVSGCFVLFILFMNAIILFAVFVQKCSDCGGCSDSGGSSINGTNATSDGLPRPGCYYDDGRPERVMGGVVIACILGAVAAAVGSRYTE